MARWLESLRSQLANDGARIRQKLLGAWQLVSWEGRDVAGTRTYPLGPDAIGQIAYDASGRMSAQLVRPHQARFASEDWQVATAEEKADAWGNYF